MTRPELIKALEDNGAQFKGYKRARGEALQAAYDAVLIQSAPMLAEVTQAPPPKARANWGANENPRGCRKCKSANSRVTDTKTFLNPPRVVRYRVCGDCGQKFSTLEVTA